MRLDCHAAADWQPPSGAGVRCINAISWHSRANVDKLLGHCGILQTVKKSLLIIVMSTMEFKFK